MAKNPIYLIVTPFFPFKEDWRGGFVEDFVKAMARTGDWDVRVMLLDYKGLVKDFEVDGIKVMALPFKRLPGMCFPMFYAKENIATFCRVLKEHGIAPSEVAVLNAHTAICTIYAQALDCVTLEHHHDCESFGLHLGWLQWSRIYRWLEKRLLLPWHRRMTAHVFVSERVRRNFEAAIGKQVEGYVLYNGVDKRIFPQRARMPQNGQLTIGCIGNFERGNEAVSKNQEVLIRSLAGIENVQVRFIGTGTTQKTCENLAKLLGVNCRWDEERRHAELAAWYKDLDLFILPSSVEGFGCVFTEAYACGVPFICSDRAGVAELIAGDRERWTFKAGDADDLRRKIAAWRERRGQQKLAEYDIDILVPRFNEYVRGLIKRQ